MNPSMHTPYSPSSFGALPRARPPHPRTRRGDSVIQGRTRTSRALSCCGWTLAVFGMLAQSACQRPSACTPAGLPPETRAAFAVLTVDERYDATAIALLDADAELLHEAWVDSGSTPAGISSTLHNDVVLPSKALPLAGLWVISRLGRNSISRFDLASGAARGQWSSQAEQGAAFGSNPQDLASLRADSVWLTRYGRNFAPDAAPHDRGNDLVELDAESGRILQAISLEAADQVLATEQRAMEGSDDETASPALPAEAGEPGEERRPSSQTNIFARPNQLLAHGRHHLLVGLDRLSDDFRSTGDGAVAWVDTRNGSVEIIDLAPLRNCGTLAALPAVVSSSGEAAKARAVVLCRGPTFAFQPEDRAPSAGFAVIALPETTEAHGEGAVVDDPDAAPDAAPETPPDAAPESDGANKPTVLMRWSFDVQNNAPRDVEHAPYGSLLAISDRVVVASTLGSGIGGDIRPAVLRRYDLETRESAPLIEADTSAQGLAIDAFGSGAVLREGTGSQGAGPVGAGPVDAGPVGILIPDATRGILRFSVREDTLIELASTLNVSPCRRLRARQVTALARP